MENGNKIINRTWRIQIYRTESVLNRRNRHFWASENLREDFIVFCLVKETQVWYLVYEANLNIY